MTSKIRNKKLIVELFLVSLMLIIALKPVLSASPFIADTVSGYNVEPVFREYIKENDNYRFQVHVFNQSTGMPIIAGTTCYLHLYNSTGNHLVVMEKGTVEHTFDYEFLVNGGNFTRGVYEIKLQCNSSSRGGTSEFSFEVTQNGKAPAPSSIIILFSLIFIILVGISCYIFLYTIGHLISLDFDIIDMAVNWGLYFAVIITYYLENFYLDNYFMNDYLVWFISIGWFFLILIPIIAFLLSLIMGNLNNKPYSPRRVKLGRYNG